MNFILWLLIALVCGITLSFSQSPTEYWFLIFPCFSLFYYSFTKIKNKGQCFTLGFIFALGYFIAGLNWIGNALLVEGNEYRWVWPLAVIALPILLSLFTALYLTVSYILFKNKSSIAFFSFCFFIFLSEFVRGHVFTGFPWNLYGYGWIGVLEIAQMTSIIGSYGLTLLTIFWGSVLGFIAHNKKSFPILIIATASLIAAYFWGAERLKNNPVKFNEAVTFHVIQPNIDQADKWKPEKLAQNFEEHISLSRVQKSAGKNIILWSETALSPPFLESIAAHERIRSLLDKDTILLTGVLATESGDNKREVKYYNGLMVWYHDKPPVRVYDKSHLVPFGEYIPFQDYIPLRPVVDFAGFQKGNGTKIVQLEGLPSFTPKICYEIIFPNQMILDKNNRPDFILTITNDGWYGDSAGPYQHFTQARFRAIENQIPVVRAANTGISGIIDRYGRIVKKTELLAKSAISLNYPY